MQERFYVTVVDGKRVGFLLGPYDTRVEALDAVEYGRLMALHSDGHSRSWFYAYGTCKVTSDNPKKTVFGR